MKITSVILVPLLLLSCDFVSGSRSRKGGFGSSKFGANIQKAPDARVIDRSLLTGGIDRSLIEVGPLLPTPPHFRYGLVDQDEESLQTLFENEGKKYHIYDYLLSLMRSPNGVLLHRNLKLAETFHYLLKKAEHKLRIRRTRLLDEMSLIKTDIELSRGDAENILVLREVLEKVKLELEGIERKILISEEFQNETLGGIHTGRISRLEEFDYSSDKGLYRHGMVGKTDEAIRMLVRKDREGLFALLRKLAKLSGEDGQMEFEDEDQVIFFMEVLVEEADRLVAFENDLYENWRNEKMTIAKEEDILAVWKLEEQEKESIIEKQESSESTSRASRIASVFQKLRGNLKTKKSKEEENKELKMQNLARQIDKRKELCHEYGEKIAEIHLKLRTVRRFQDHCLTEDTCFRYTGKTAVDHRGSLLGKRQQKKE